MKRSSIEDDVELSAATSSLLPGPNRSLSSSPDNSTLSSQFPFELEYDNGDTIANSKSLRWNNRKDKRWGRSILIISVVVIVSMGLFGSIGRVGSLTELKVKWNNNFDLKMMEVQASRCRPYTQHGALFVNTSIARLNYWEPVDPDPACYPVDYLNMIREQSESGELSFVKDRLVVLFGDSVDRDHIHHMCGFLGGQLEMIASDHALSPAYPEGLELPPVGYVNFQDQSRTWPNNDQSRPWLCTVKLQLHTLRILNVFHYGFSESHSKIITHGHYYPPYLVEDRFHQILLPMLSLLAARESISPIPDLLSFTPGFWCVLRGGWRTTELREELIKEGHDGSEAVVQAVGNWASINRQTRSFWKRRVEEIMRDIGQAWPVVEGKSRKPKILFRTLHHIDARDLVPFNHVQLLNEISLAMVEKLISEGKLASRSEKSRSNWISPFKSTESRSNISRAGFGERLAVDDWSSKILGQQHHTRDGVHPHPLPSSYLYGNMLLENLKVAIEDDESFVK